MQQYQKDGQLTDGFSDPMIDEAKLAEQVKESLDLFKLDLKRALNAHNIDTFANTPDFILADLLYHNVMAVIKMQSKRDAWNNAS